MLEKSPYVQPLIASLKMDGFVADIEKVDYELQRGGNEMLRIHRGAQLIRFQHENSPATQRWASRSCGSHTLVIL
jgi:hypothetical protein